MSKLEELIVKLCPHGVEYYTLNECFDQFSGMGGVTNKWADAGNCQFVDYMNAYNHIAVDVQDLPFATVKNLNQTVLRQGDVLFTSASETPDECAISSLIEDEIKDGIFLDDHLFGLRVKKQFSHMIFMSFLKYVFRTNNFRKQVNKAVRGVTRFYVSKQDFMKLVIPVPPLEVQREIVRVLDNFTFLTAELTAELTARKKQYEYYRNKMIFTEDIPLVELRSVVKSYCAGATPKKGNKLFYENGTIPWIRTQDVRFNEIYEVDSYITEAAVEQTAARWIPENCVIVAISGASAGRCAINKIKATTNQHCLNMVIDDTKALYEYVYYCIAGRYDELISRKQGARGDLNSSLILGITIPVPPLEEQRRIVSLLNKFNKLLNNISIGLPAEIAARQKQYEYYRDKLLTFKELNA